MQDSAADGTYKVTFLDRPVPQDSCMPSDAGAEDAGPQVVVVTATVDATCTLALDYSQTWCFSGEQQCEEWDMTLSISGDSGSGTATRIGGWCMDKKTTTYTVSAGR